MRELATVTRKEGVVYSAATSPDQQQGPAYRGKLTRPPRTRRRIAGALSDRPIRLARDLHVGSEFLWTRSHR